MKTTVNPFTPLFMLPACVSALLCLSSVSGASFPPPADSVHIHLHFNYEQYRRDHPRPAQKRAADLNVGEPRTVRMIYFLPNDRPYRAEVVDSMKVVMRRIQAFYAEKMQAHGYGDETFRIETDAEGEPLVHRVDGQHPDNVYLDDTIDPVLQEIEQTFDIGENVYFVAIDKSIDILVDKARNVIALGIGLRMRKNGGLALVTAGFRFNVAAHELGHAFGLRHDFRSNEYIMSYGDSYEPRLSDCHAGLLAVHPYLNPAIPIEEAPPPAIQRLSETEYPAGSESVSVRFRLSDAEGLHQVLLIGEERGGGIGEVLSCRNLAGKEDEDVEFEYDGYSPSYAAWGYSRRLSDTDVFRLESLVVDRAGNAGSQLLELRKEQEEGRRASTIAIISGDNQEGTPGTALANPLVVEVRDQHGQPLADATIQFGVVEGEARLSGRYLVENGTTDAGGRAELSLSLGPNAQTAIVRVSVPWIPECNPVVFTAIGVAASAVPLLHGDAHSWHLPDGAIARLGNGRLGEGDRAVSFSPDGQRLAVASGIGVWLYDVATSRPQALWPTSGTVQSVTFSRDGTLLAAAGGGQWGEKVILWDVATGIRKFTLKLYYSASVAFSPDGTLLASGSRNRLVRLWDLATRRVVATWGEELLGILVPVSVAFSPDGAVLAGGFRDGTVRMWDVATRDPVVTLRGHRSGVRSVAFSRDGRMLASGSADGDIRLWDVKAWKNPVILREHRRQVGSLDFLLDRRTLASGSLDGTVRLWDIGSGKQVTTIHGGGDASEITAISSSPDGRTIASASWWTGEIVLWDPRTGNGTGLDGAVHAGVGDAVAFSPDGKTLASGSSDGTPKLWDARTGRFIKGFGKSRTRILAVAFSPDGATLAVGSWGSIIELWDVATGNLIASFQSASFGTVHSMAFSPDGTTLAEGNLSGVALWDVASVSAEYAALGERVFGDRAKAHYISTPSNGVLSVAFSPDGTVLASSVYDGAPNLWNASTLAHIATLIDERATRTNYGVSRVSFSSDGTTLAVVHPQQIELWDVQTQERTTVFARRADWEAEASTISFSPTGLTLAVGDGGGTVILWDVASQEPTATLEGHRDGVESLSFSPDGSTLASGSYDGTILMWDVATQLTRPAVPSDFDGDGVVGFSDFVQFASAFGLNSGEDGYETQYDLDGNGVIGFSDFLIFAESFGKTAS